MKARVALTKCDSYDQATVDAALSKSLKLIGGLGQFIKPGHKVLIKPNILSASAPETAVATHPAIVSAVVRAVKAAGATALVGDSPSNAHAFVPSTLAKTGIKQAAEAAGGQTVLLQQSGIAEISSPSRNQRMRTYAISKLAIEADVIINLPKIKTHNLTAYTGAIKNMFGVVPGFYKSKFHVNAIRPRDLAGLLVDVFEIAKPSLNIMDAVMGMEGNGPAGGQPRKLGVIIASSDGVALDAVGSYLIGFDPLKIETTARAASRGVGQADLDQISIIGEKLNDIAQRDWQHSTNKSTLANLLPEPLFNLLKPIANQLRINPEIIQEKCTQCLVCVKNCPVQTIDYDKTSKIVSINLKRCINCFCCHEMCEYQAIDLKPSWLVRLLRIPL
jgi:uncharacterized protein (DUF362 family)/NAD-dependent dihydropyrimidine dehydrogenase PreA subunit